MQAYKYLIVGGGMTADAATRGIRQVDADGTIGLISLEKFLPYNRPPLSKGLWKGKPIEKIWRGTQNRNVDIHLETQAIQLDPDHKIVTDQNGEQYQYHFLLLATGGKPRKLPAGDGQIIYYRYLGDFYRLQELSQKEHTFTVIGSGFIGSEISAALAMNNKAVNLIFRTKGIGGNVFPPDLSDFLNQYYRERGVKIYPNTLVEEVVTQGEQKVVILQSGQQVRANQVVAGLGIEPDDTLAKQAGLEIDNGIVVNEYLQTSDPSIYAAGDVAAFINPSLDKRIRMEHEDNANEMGLTAGQNMAGERIPYTHLPYFYSDLFDLGYEAVGELNSHYEMIEDWQDPFHKGAVYYLEDDRVRGVLLWNLWGKVDAAREIIARHKIESKDNLIGQIT